jgi:hypothetical protein
LVAIAPRLEEEASDRKIFLPVRKPFPSLISALASIREVEVLGQRHDTGTETTPKLMPKNSENCALQHMGPKKYMYVKEKLWRQVGGGAQ